MVTNYPQQLAATSEAEARNDADTSGFMARMVIRMNQAVCGLHGHDSVLHFESNRVMMRCTSCGYDSPGWEISGQGPRLRYKGDAERHLLSSSRPRMVA
jgi:hypothetical protein